MQNKVIDIGESKPIYTSLADPRVNAFVEQHPAKSIFHSRVWLDLISELYRYPVIPLVTANAAGQISGFLPLCLINSPLTGRRLVALPFSDNCPLLAADQASANDLIEQALCLAQRKRVKYLELRTGSHEALDRCSDLLQGNLYVRWLLPLTVDPDATWSGLRKAVQKRIKKSQRAGVRVYIAQNREDVVQHYRLHLLTRSKKHGMPVQPLRFFFGLWDAFAASGTLQLLLAE